MKNKKNAGKPPYLIILLLVLAILIAYSGAFNSEFTNCDDNAYVTQNGHVKEGLTWRTIVWAFTTTEQANWHPMTWLSFALDSSLFGLRAGYFHGTNVVLHILSTILLFLLFDRVTRSRWQSAFVAAVFALHPVHVESVAWIAERKDVLAGLFWMLAMGAYFQYQQTSQKRYYILLLGLFTLGLMSKPLLVTFPFVLLLLDYWPLHRFGLYTGAVSKDKKATPVSWKMVILEKVPLLVLTLGSSVVTFLAQQAGEAMKMGEKLPLFDKIANAFTSYGQYMIKTVVPTNLAIFYPHPGKDFSVTLFVFSLLIVMLLTFIVWRQRTNRPFLVTGWLWFLGTLVPMIGIVQVGMQAMADRYMYIPMIGLSIMVAWGIPSLVGRIETKRSLITGIFILLVLAMTYGSYLQVSYWKNNSTVFRHALAVTSNNYFAHYCLGVDLADSGKMGEAVPHFREAVRIKPSYPPTYSDLGAALADLGKREEAIKYFRESFRLMPSRASAYNNYGVAMAQEGKLDEAERQWRRAIELDSNYADPHVNLGRLFTIQKKTTEAIQQFESALRLNPNHIDGHLNYGELLAGLGRIEEARRQYQEVLRIAPLNRAAQSALGKLVNK